MYVEDINRKTTPSHDQPTNQPINQSNHINPHHIEPHRMTGAGRPGGGGPFQGGGAGEGAGPEAQGAARGQEPSRQAHSPGEEGQEEEEAARGHLQGTAGAVRYDYSRTLEDSFNSPSDFWR